MDRDGFGPEPEAGRDVDEEIAFHLAMREEQNRARGLDAESARAEARQRFGDVARVRAAILEEGARSRREGVLRRAVSGIRADFRQAFRHLRRSPAYAVVAVLTLALGLGATALTYGLAAPYFLRALPFADADRLVHLFQVDRRSGYDRDRFSLPQLRDLRERSHAFEGLAAYSYRSSNLTGPEGPERVTLAAMTSNAFDVLGARPALGRTFSPGEDAAADVVVLSWGLWQRRYAGDADIVGRTIPVDGRVLTVVGVMPRDFAFPFNDARAWVPLEEQAGGDPREVWPHLIFGRLAEGWTRERATSELATIHAGLAQTYPDADGQADGIVIVELREALNFAWDILRIASIAMAGAVLVVLLIACANIAGLGLARAEGRRLELAVRGALGASSFRLVRQILVETLVVATLGGGLAFLVARLGLRTLGTVLPPELFHVGEFDLDAGAVLFLGAVVLVAAVLAGIGPALLAARSGAAATLREDGRTAGGLRAGRMRRGLVVAQVALGLVLAVGAGLMARSLGQARDVPLGFVPGPVLTAEIVLPDGSYRDPEAVSAFFDRYTEALRGLPGVRSVATHSALPLNHETSIARVAVEGVPMVEDERPLAQYFRSSQDYFETMGIPLLEGRDFGTGDTFEGDPVAIVNRSFARDVLGGDAVGRRILLGSGTTVRRVIGVVDDVRHEDVAATVGPQVYLAMTQAVSRRRFVVIRTAGDPAAFTATARSTLATVDADLPAVFQPMSAVVDVALLQWRALAAMLALFGILALGLAAVGLYGLIAYSVERRRREIGVRLALGARHGDVTRMIVNEGLRLAGIGIALGLVGSLAAGRVVAAALFGVQPHDPLTLGAAAFVFVAIAVLASLLPARRAVRLDPLEALRTE